jgi:hypothetical protein
LKLRRLGWFEWSLAALAVMYLVQVATPIRLDTDSVRYLMIAIGIADGVQVDNIGAPSGYPALVGALIRAGLGSTPWIIGLNVVFIGGGLIALWQLSRHHELIVRQWTILLSLLSFSMLRAVVMPNTEPVYFGISLVALAAMDAAISEQSRRRFLYIAGALVLTVFAVTVRLVGVSLIPALVMTIVATLPIIGRRAARRSAVMVVIAVIAGTAVAAIVVSEQGTLTRYLFESKAIRGFPALDIAVRQLRFMLRGMEVVFINAPLPRLYASRTVFPWLGILPMVFLLGTVRRAKWRPPVSIYVISYGLILLAWPFFARRLWLPILPLLILHAGAALRTFTLPRWGRRVVAAYIAFFILTGVACLGYITRITLAGKKFRAEYGVAGGMASPEHEMTMHNTYARKIISRLDSGREAWKTLEDSIAAGAFRR